MKKGFQVLDELDHVCSPEYETIEEAIARCETLYHEDCTNPELESYELCNYDVIRLSDCKTVFTTALDGYFINEKGGTFETLAMNAMQGLGLPEDEAERMIEDLA